MKKSDYVIIAIEYVISVFLSATSNVHAVTNPYFSDYLTEGIGMMVGAFLITSIFTIPIQMSGGWDKQQYARKTIRGIPIVLGISVLSRFI